MRIFPQLENVEQYEVRVCLFYHHDNKKKDWIQIPEFLQLPGYQIYYKIKSENYSE